MSGAGEMSSRLPAGAASAPDDRVIRRHGLQARLLSIVLAGAACFAVAAGGAAYFLGHARALESGRATMEGLVTAVERTAAIGAYAGDRVLLQEVVDGVARNPLVGRVEIRGPAGLVLASPARFERGAGASVLSVEHMLPSPFDRGETVGSLRIDADPTQLEAAARSEATLFALLMTAQAALAALLLYLVAARFVTRPIVQLAASLRSLTPGTSTRLPTPPQHRRDEIGVLIGGANDLLHANEVALQRERELRADIEVMEAQYRQIFDSSSAGIFVLDESGRLINSNPTALRVIGLSLDAMKHLRGDEFLREVFMRPERVLGMMADATERGETVSADLELRQRERASSWVHCLISVQGKADQRRLIEGVMYDITERKRTESAVRHQAEHDALTGLPNRAATEAAIDRFVAEAAAGGSMLSVLYLDLDGFKQVNDRFGHKAGDQVLQRCALRMQGVMRRASDVVGRIGGDEFVVALNHLGPSDPALAQVALQLLDRLREPITLDDGQMTRIGASIGIACYPRHGVSRKGLLHAADAAMYEVKRFGKDSYATALEASMVS